MSDPAGRYEALPGYRRSAPGEPDRLLRVPRLPGTAASDGTHRVAVGERLDALAARYLDDPYAWWRFADAAPGVPLDELDAPGRVLRLPRRGG
ncbi:hypothetical protein [Micromonospora sp. NPDC005806]|uniref:hypothetical protein n=1 Tax=Micromonospora sp. NPDC005806 TaxID=3364234 RepID=UPI003675D4A5